MGLHGDAWVCMRLLHGSAWGCLGLHGSAWGCMGQRGRPQMRKHGMGAPPALKAGGRLRSWPAVDVQAAMYLVVFPVESCSAPQ
jgi:hypothetical protein